METNFEKEAEAFAMAFDESSPEDVRAIREMVKGVGFALQQWEDRVDAKKLAFGEFSKLSKGM